MLEFNEENNESGKNSEKISNKRKGQKVKREKKKHPVRNRAIFLMLFSAICIGITLFLILKSHGVNNIGQVKDIIENKKQENEFVPDGLGVKSLEDTYTANKLKIKHILYSKPKFEYTKGYYYIQIDGLANKEIEEKINKELKDEYIAMGDEVTSECTANFANVISVCYSSYNNEGINVKTFNYDLTTGNKIELKDMFTNDTSIKNILTKAISDCLLLEHAGSDSYWIDDDILADKNQYGEERALDETAMATIEDTVFKYITDFNNGYKYDFYFSPKNIYILRDNHTILISMSKYSSNIAIYNRYSENKDIYDNKYSNFNPIENESYFVFTTTGDVNILANPYGSEGILTKYSNLYKKADNLYYGISLQTNYNKTDSQEDIDNITEALKVVKNLIDEDCKNVNPNKCFIRTYSVTMWEDDNLNISYDEFSTDKSNSDIFYKDILGYYQGNGYIFYWSEYYTSSNMFKNIKVNRNKNTSYYSNYKYNKSKKVWEQKRIEYENGKKIEDDEETSKPKEEEPVVPVISDGSKVIVIDPGHQTKANNEKEPIGPGASETKAKVTGGAKGVATGKAEYQVNLEVSLKLKAALENKGYTVIMTRTTNDVNLSNSQRAQIANKANAAAFIRVHCNSYDDSSANGVLTMCQTANNPYNANLAPQSYKLSKAVLDNVVGQTGANNKGVTRTDTMSGINWCTVPTTIIEMGFMSNPEEDKLLASSDYQDKIVKGIVAGIDEFLQ